MGLDINAVQFLIAARRMGMEFGDAVMLGRQDLNVYPARMRQILGQHGYPADAFAPGAPDTAYAEPVFKALGARTISSLDASSFEGAAFVHDLNQPLPPELHQRFDLVYDGGTLEHVFNYPQALKNCMEMVKLNGCFIAHTVGNNWWGHGFYQFSPELFYRALNDQNGFKVERMIAHIVGPYGRWFEVPDPAKIQSRIEATTFAPVQLLVLARRERIVPIFATPPQQSDYTPRWKEDSRDMTEEQLRAKAWAAQRPGLSRSFPRLARLFNVAKIGWHTFYTLSMRNRRNFRPVRRP